MSEEAGRADLVLNEDLIITDDVAVQFDPEARLNQIYAYGVIGIDLGEAVACSVALAMTWNVDLKDDSMRAFLLTFDVLVIVHALSAAFLYSCGVALGRAAGREEDLPFQDPAMHPIRGRLVYLAFVLFELIQSLWTVIVILGLLQLKPAQQPDELYAKAPILWWTSQVIIWSNFVMLVLPFFLVILAIFSFPLVVSLIRLVAPSILERAGRTQGATQASIDALPTQQYHRSPVPDIENTTNNKAEPPERCTVCLANYEDGDTLRILPCKHQYHLDCIDEWLHINGCCPLCLARIDQIAAVAIPTNSSPSINPTSLT